MDRSIRKIHQFVTETISVTNNMTDSSQVEGGLLVFMHAACAALHPDPNLLSLRFVRLHAEHVSAASPDQKLGIKLLLQQDEHHHNHSMQH